MPAAPQRQLIDGEDDFVSVDNARLLLGTDGRPVPRERVFQLGLEGELVLQRFASRWFVSKGSIEDWRARHEAVT